MWPGPLSPKFVEDCDAKLLESRKFSGPFKEVAGDTTAVQSPVCFLRTLGEATTLSLS